MSVLVSLCTLLFAFLLWRAVRPQPSAKSSVLAGVRGPKKEHWLTGNFRRIFKDGLQYNLALFKEYGGVIKVHGILGAEQLLVHDPLALQQILVRDQESFEETDMFIDTNRLLFGEGLIATLGEQHKKQRKLLNPVFSLANLRAVLPRIQPIANELTARLQAELPQDGGFKEVDVLPWLRKGTLEYVGRGILGVNLDSLDPAKANAFTSAICNVQHVALKVFFLRPFVPWAVRNLSPYWGNKLVEWLPFPALRELREISHVLQRSARDIFLAKKAEVEETGADEESSTDLMSIMLRANSSTQEKSRLSNEELIGQINTFMLGGQETTTSALARLLHVLAQEQEAQERLRSEIREAKLAHATMEGKSDTSDWQRVSLPYDVLIGLPYLDAVVRETLRLYPPTSMMNRTTTKDTILHLQYPVHSAMTGLETSAVHVPAGTNVIVSILGANRSKRVWGPDASVWRPERWLAQAPAGERVDTSVAGRGVDLEFGDESVGEGSGMEVRYPGVYGSMMTFFGGSRACIGFKFAEMEIKQVLATLLSTMHFALPSATDAAGNRKEIYWRMDGLQVPVVLPPHGDATTAQVPLDIRVIAPSVADKA
ncbi:cytochrome P450 [Cubamyces sp. BRFM 1775]|nr:cytochrome P450 [Cubamyces sp. BRFM 1775]